VNLSHAGPAETSDRFGYAEPVPLAELLPDSAPREFTWRAKLTTTQRGAVAHRVASLVTASTTGSNANPPNWQATQYCSAPACCLKQLWA